MSAPASVLVVGGGTMGLAATWALARRGHRVTMLERFEHVHDRGSHGGYTRIIRHAYHEGPFYVDLVDRADRLWTELEARAKDRLLIRSGLLELGRPGDPEFESACSALRDHGVPHEVFDAAEARERFAPFRVPDGWTGTFSPRSGYLRVVACLDALRREAEAAGATLRHNVRVNEIVRGGDRPRVLLEDGRLEVADRVVVCAGAFTSKLMPHLRVRSGRRLVSTQRRVLAWTKPPETQLERLARLPAWAMFAPEGFFYGFPFGEEGLRGFKLACHAVDSSDDPPAGVDPDAVDRSVDEADLAPLRRFLAERLGGEAGEVEHSRVCLYGNSPSGDFVLDALPDDPSVVVAAGFSGHGFKFAPVVGELLADLVAGEGQPVEAFRLATHVG